MTFLSGNSGAGGGTSIQGLTSGFCSRVSSHCTTAADFDLLRRDFANPCVQVIDIQRYPSEEAPVPEASRFYLALSDAESIVWAIAPPGTELEEQIAQFELDVGCCATLRAFHVVTAACGVNVVVVLAAAFSPNPQSLLGQPVCDESFFSLSDASLLKAQHVVPPDSNNLASQALTGAAAAEEILLRDIVEKPQCVLAPWKVALRVAWRGATTQLHRYRSTANTQQASASHPQRSLVRLIGVDRLGACICCVVWIAGDGLDVPPFHVGDCLLLRAGSVKWSELGLPTELQFNSRDIQTVLSSAVAPAAFPVCPRLLIGNLATSLKSVEAIIAESKVDDVVSVTAVVRTVQAASHVNTKHGRVLCAAICVEDAADAGTTIDITLWGDAAEQVRPARDELWLFHFCTVREFRQKKTLSSRSTSLFCRLSPVDENAEPHDEPPGGDGDALTYDTLAELANAAMHPLPPDADALSRNQSDPTAPAPRSLQLSLSLADAAPTMPVLVRVGDVLLLRAATDLTSIPRADTPVLSLVLSDGFECVTAVGGWDALVSLVGVTAAETIHTVMPTSHRFLHDLIGAPLLVWLLPCRQTCAVGEGDGGGGGHDPAQATADFVVVQCRHAQLALCASALLSSIDQIYADE